MATDNAAYLAGRFKYKRPQAMLWANNPGITVDKFTATGLQATLSSSAPKNVILTSGTTTNIIPGQNLSKTSGAGAFGIEAKVDKIISLTEFTVTINHLTEGSIVFKTGSIIYVPDGDEFSDYLVISDHNRGPIDFKKQRIEKRERMVNGRMRSYHIADKTVVSTSWNQIPSRAFDGPPSFNANGKSNVFNQTVDGGAGGNDLLNWYETNTGSFWVYLAYDKYLEFGNTQDAYGHLQQYNEVIEVFFSDFSHSVQKRGGSTPDLWNISATLEEA